MRVWTVANQKGGVGKTTTTVALGGVFARWGLRTLLIDLDPHGSLTSYFRYDPESLDENGYSLFEAAAEGRALCPQNLVYQTGVDALSLIPATVALATLDRQSGRREGLGLVLSRAVRELDEDYDQVLIDCPPILGVLLINALAACDQLLIPVQTEFLAIKGLDRMLSTLRMVTRARPRPLEHLVVPTFFDKRTRASRDSLLVLQRSYAEHLWQDVIPVDTRFREASRSGLPPAAFDPASRGARAYGRLAETLLGTTATADRRAVS